MMVSVKQLPPRRLACYENLIGMLLMKIQLIVNFLRDNYD